MNHVLAEMIETGRWNEIFDRWLVQTNALASGGPTTFLPPVAQYRDG